MLSQNKKIAFYAEASMGLTNAKMAEGIIRYGHNPAVAVVDSTAAGKTLSDVCKINSDVPIVSSIQEAIALGAEVLVLGTAPSGGRFPKEWNNVVSVALSSGLSVVNGLHDRLNDIYGKNLKKDQWIWDVRTPVGGLPPIANARAATLRNKRVLMVGTDMAVGKMTAGLEIYETLKGRSINTIFLATGQTGITIMGAGVPLDAYKVDHAGGAVEQLVMGAAKHDIVIIEGQGSLLHPGSTATLPLMRGSCPTHMILCHRAGMEYVDTAPGAKIKIPSLREVISLNEMVASANGALTTSKVVGVSLNTRDLDQETALLEIKNIESELGLPVTDPVRFGAEALVNALM